MRDTGAIGNWKRCWIGCSARIAWPFRSWYTPACSLRFCAASSPCISKHWHCMSAVWWHQDHWTQADDKYRLCGSASTRMWLVYCRSATDRIAEQRGTSAAIGVQPGVAMWLTRPGDNCCTGVSDGCQGGKRPSGACRGRGGGEAGAGGAAAAQLCAAPLTPNGPHQLSRQQLAGHGCLAAAVCPNMHQLGKPALNMQIWARLLATQVRRN